MSYVDPSVDGTPAAGGPIKSAWGDDVQTDIEYFKTFLTPPVTIAATATYQDPVVDFTANGIDRFRFRVISTGGGATDFRIIGTAAAPAIMTLVAPNGTDYADYTYEGSNADFDVSAGNISLRPLAGNVQVWAPSAQVKLRVGNSGFTQALDIYHDGTNANLVPTTGIIKLTAAVQIGTRPAFVSGDKYLIVDSNGNVHVSSLGPAS